MKEYVKCFLTMILCGGYVLLSFLRKPHPLALTSAHIRIVEFADEREVGVAMCNAAYKVLLLLEQYDMETYARVKKHIRIICLISRLSPNINAATIPTGRFYWLSAQRFPPDFPIDSLPIRIAGSLAWQATLAELNGWVAYYNKSKGAAIKETCRKEQQTTLDKLQKALNLKRLD